jgi:16S rRNA (guanine1207-N2)-methyltransferase
MKADPLATLFLLFETGRMSWPQGKILFMNARTCPALARLGARPEAVNHFRPEALALERAGFEILSEAPESGTYDAVLYLSPRQHEEALSNMAEGLAALKPGGLFVCAAANDAGGKRLAADLKSFDCTPAEESKNRARVVWAYRPPDLNEKAIETARQAGAPARQPATGLIAQPGLFSYDRIDPGSALLADTIPDASLKGDGADFGCGYGFLSLHIRDRQPDVRILHMIDADARALACCRENIGESPTNRVWRWADITDEDEILPERLDFIVMNPPFHERERANPAIGRRFISRAAQALRPGGVLWMVANSFLPYEDELRRGFRQVEPVRQEKGFRIWRGEK